VGVKVGVGVQGNNGAGVPGPGMDGSQIAVGVADGVAVGVSDGVGVSVIEGIGVTVTTTVTGTVTLTYTICVTMRVLMTTTVLYTRIGLLMTGAGVLPLGLSVGVPLPGVVCAVRVDMAESVPIIFDVGVMLGVRVGSGVAVFVAVLVTVGVADGLNAP
jgi:hypothetical protein